MASKEALQLKLEALQQQLSQLKVNANAVQGAIQVIEQLLAEDEAADKKDS